MNIIEAIRELYDIAELIYERDAEAKRTVGDFLDAYDALVPPIEDWPADMVWFAIDASGAADWHVTEPAPDLYWAQWESGTEEEAGRYLIAPGIDWQRCKWRRRQTDEL
jgi:hypothetical protein